MAILETRNESQTRDTALGQRIDDLVIVVDGKATEAYVDGKVRELLVALDQKQPVGDYVTLVSGKVDPRQIPEQFDNVLIVNTTNDLPKKGNTHTLYVCKDSCNLWFYNIDKYELLKNPIIFGEEEGMCFDGARGKAVEDAVARNKTQIEASLRTHLENDQNPHHVTAAQVGALSFESDPVFQEWKNGKSVLAGENSYAGVYCCAIGRNSSSSNESVAIGPGAKADLGSVAIGLNCESRGYFNISIGAETSCPDDRNVAVLCPQGLDGFTLFDGTSEYATLNDLIAERFMQRPSGSGMTRLDTFDVEGATDMEVRNALRNCINFINKMFFNQ